MKKIIPVVIVLLIVGTLLILPNNQKKEKESFKIVTSFYPMYTIVKNIVDETEGVTIDNMANHNIGCLHNYTLTAADLKKIESADIFVLNGLGIENFSDKILETYSNIKTIEASEGINDLIADENEKNAHIWVSISKYIKQIENVKNGLIKYDQDHAEAYTKNANEYIDKLKELKQEISEKTKNKKKCVSFSESIAYLSEDFNIDMLTIETEHEQNGLSAEKLSDIIKYVKENNIKNILIDKQTADNNAKAVANETGAKIYVLDAVLTGEDDAESYVNIMKENLKIVESME
ncbi:MAG: zinc ABC transporter substrate-binding protein [Clostridia bacterium]|nr:zinc ABC transporter substrate-binding protein [Clostridia bacterium]